MCRKASANTALFSERPRRHGPIRQLCSHFRNCQAQKMHEIGGGIGNAKRGRKTRIEVPPAMLRPHRANDRAYRAYRSLDSGVTGPAGNYDNYRNSWGAIRPAKRQKRARARLATRRRRGGAPIFSLIDPFPSFFFFFFDYKN
ncbi:hypothetical protein ACS0PU_013163 [Formica fusca]